FYKKYISWSKYKLTNIFHRQAMIASVILV
ncbi:MAG: hypothetical protein ACI9CD_001015, partial [Candidatus Deianiraeaceae bacterium]